MRFSPTSAAGFRLAGFSLVELLMVIAVIGVLAVLVAPALSSILGAKGVTRGASDVAAVLELARMEAMARRTYVYVGFENTTNALGNAELCIAAVASPDGSSATTADLIPVTKVVRVANIRQTDYNGLPQIVRDSAIAATNNSFYVSGMTSSGIHFSVGPQTFDDSMLIFSPEGELLPVADTPVFLDRAHVGLVGMKGNSPNPNDGTVLTCEGGSGAITTIRP